MIYEYFRNSLAPHGYLMFPWMAILTKKKFTLITETQIQLKYFHICPFFKADCNNVHVCKYYACTQACYDIWSTFILFPRTTS